MRTRPSSARARESIFSRLTVRIDLTGARVLDLFAGSGSLGIEALSRGAAHVTFVDSSREASAIIRENLESMRLIERGRIIVRDLLRALHDLGGADEKFDVVFVDAPFKDDTSNVVVEAIGRHGLVIAGGWIVVEQSKRAPEPPEPPEGFERTTVARIGDHRIAFYLRKMAPAEMPVEG